jgi:hypothetical protein
LVRHVSAGCPADVPTANVIDKSDHVTTLRVVVLVAVVHRWSGVSLRHYVTPPALFLTQSVTSS